ncbi:unnamed protein product [Spodoptera exigua]|nr:unnamed protein product [Spodoptera exigua]
MQSHFLHKPLLYQFFLFVFVFFIFWCSVVDHFWKDKLWEMCKIISILLIQACSVDSPY